ncbi:MAG: PLP-dependent aminotransferase family protein [Rhodothermales bacterium]
MPLYLQMYHGLREAILARHLEPGTRLPSTRALAHMWQVSRSTVVLAFEHLVAEGYLITRPGSGTFVHAAYPERTTTSAPDVSSHKTVMSTPEAKHSSERGRAVVHHYHARRKLSDRPLPFRPGVPAEETFPTVLWGRLAGRFWRSVSSAALAQQDPFGYLPLRTALADYLRSARGLRVSPEQVLMTTSSQHALTLIAQLLTDPGDVVWIEDPGYPRAQAALQATGARLAPVPVDAQGFDVHRAQQTNAGARLAYVTPAHQYPLGVTMSLQRRLGLLEWAVQHNGWVVEDDYISEYRYTGRPLAALQSLDPHGRVLYMGTFSKLFSPTLRLSYVVLPDSLIDLFTASRSLIDRGPSFGDQATMTAFMEDGHFSRHIRRMRTLYAERHEALTSALKEAALPQLTVTPSQAGTHLVARLSPPLSDAEVTAMLAEAGLMAPALSYFTLTSAPSALLLGFSGWPPSVLREGIEQLALQLGRWSA